MVSRMVPEKRHLDLLAAFAAADLTGWKVVLEHVPIICTHSLHAGSS
jgi:hypothetical protein